MQLIHDRHMIAFSIKLKKKKNKERKKQYEEQIQTE